MLDEKGQIGNRLLCSNCASEITGQPVLSEGQFYCCQSCANTAPRSERNLINQVTEILESCISLLKDSQQSGNGDQSLQQACTALQEAVRSMSTYGAGQVNSLAGGAGLPAPGMGGDSGAEWSAEIEKELNQAAQIPLYELGVDAFLNARHYVSGERGKAHPHSWRIQARVSGSPVEGEGTLIGFAEIKEILQKQLAPFRDKLLNQVRPFDTVMPTTENIAAYFYEKIAPEFSQPGLRLESLSVWESPTNYVVFRKGSI